MSDFKDFMLGNAVANDEVFEFKISRFKSPFKLKAITAEEEEECRRDATSRVKVKKNRYNNELDTIKYQNLLTIKTVIYPDLNNAELQNSYGVMGAENLLTKMLLSGELLALHSKVNEVNGFNSDDEDLVEEAKN